MMMTYSAKSDQFSYILEKKLTLYLFLTLITTRARKFLTVHT